MGWGWIKGDCERGGDRTRKSMRERKRERKGEIKRKEEGKI